MKQRKRVEDALEERAMWLTGDPYFGLVLHNGAIYADAQVFGRIALAYFTRSSFPGRRRSGRFTSRRPRRRCWCRR